MLSTVDNLIFIYEIELIMFRFRKMSAGSGRSFI